MLETVAQILIMGTMAAVPAEDTTDRVCASTIESATGSSIADRNLTTTGGEFRWTYTLSSGDTVYCKVTESGSVTVNS